jgi:hypothetical protein
LHVEGGTAAQTRGHEFDHAWFASSEFIEEALRNVHRIEAAGNHAGGVTPKFAEGLGATEEEFGEQDELFGADVEGLAGDVAELLDAASGEIYLAHERLAAK